jgi:hypothetical protein
MQSVIRTLCIAYLLFLTTLLMVSDPMRLVCARGGLLALFQSLMSSAHLLSFLTLTVLGLAARWPIPRWGIAVTLVFYAGMTEIVQGFLPPRTPELQDWLQDLVGIVIGMALCWTTAAIFGAWGKPQHKESPRVPVATSDSLKIVHNVLSRSSVRAESWWE